MTLGSNNTKLQMKVKDKDAQARRLEEDSTGLDSDIVQLYGALQYIPFIIFFQPLQIWVHSNERLTF